MAKIYSHDIFKRVEIKLALTLNLQNIYKAQEITTMEGECSIDHSNLLITLNKEKLKLIWQNIDSRCREYK